MKRSLLIITFLYTFLFTYAQQANNALDFDGTNDYVQTTYDGVSGSLARTVEAWIKTTKNSSPSSGGKQQVIADYGTMTRGGRFTLNLLWGNAARIEIGGQGISGKTAVNDGKWHHVAAVYNPNATLKYSLYVDGVLDTANNMTTNINTLIQTDFRIGQRIDGINQFDGSIDEVRVWDTARTAAQIADMYNDEICSNNNGLKAYYNFNSGTASGSNSAVTTLTDNSKSTNNGTLNNFGLSGSASNWVSGASVTAAPHTDTTWSDTACGSYKMPSGKLKFSSGSHEEILENAIGCDSIITINLTILPRNTDYINVTECDSFRSNKGTLKTDSEIFWEIYQNRFGCDSLVQTLLTIHKTSRDTIPVAECKSYTTSTGQVLTQPGFYTETLVAATSCDSIVVYDFSLLSETYGSETVSQCFPFTAPSGAVYTSTGTYVDTARNLQGCDSIITYDFTLLEESETKISTVTCDSFRTESGQNFVTRSTSLSEYFKNVGGCDSIVKYKITINFSTSSTENITACKTYITPWGETVTSNGIYTGIIPNTSRCDSNMSIGVTVIKPKPTFTDSENVLTVTGSYESYQWLNCNQDFAQIDGATEQSYSPLESGRYAVEVVENDCTDTSLCMAHVSTLSILDLSKQSFTIVPNPASDKITIKSESEFKRYSILDIYGKTISSKSLDSYDIDISTLATGIYFFRLENKNQFSVVRFVKER